MSPKVGDWVTIDGIEYVWGHVATERCSGRRMS